MRYVHFSAALKSKESIANHKQCLYGQTPFLCENREATKALIAVCATITLTARALD